MIGQVKVTIRGKQWQVSVATSSAELAAGLSGVPSLPAGQGMLFDLGAPVAQVGINMSQMLFPLDVVFMDTGAKVLGVYLGLSPAETVDTFYSDMGIRFFLEVNAGEADTILPGDQAVFSGYTPPEPIAMNYLIELMVTVAIVAMMMQVMSRTVKGVK